MSLARTTFSNAVCPCPALFLEAGSRGEVKQDRPTTNIQATRRGFESKHLQNESHEEGSVVHVQP